MTSNTSKARKYLVTMIDQQIGVEALMLELEAARGGMYSRAVQAAIVAGTKEAFFTVCESLMEDFRKNKRGIGEKYAEAGLVQQAKDKAGKLRWHDDEMTEPVYTVPSSLSTAKSVLGKALDADLDLGTEKEPESFSAIRESLKAKRETERRDAMSPAEKARAKTADKLRAIADAIESSELTGKGLKAIEALCDAIADDTAKAIEKAAA